MTAHIVPIASADDPRIEPYARIRERDLVRGAKFVAEGEVVVRVLATRGRFRVDSLLLEERRVSTMGDVLDALDVPAYVAPQAVMEAIAGFPIHRGILALGDRGAPLAPADVRGPLVVGMIGLANHDNVGGIFRSAAAFGASGVLVDATTCDPLYRKAIRVSVGGALVVPFAKCESADVMLDALAGFEIFALTPRGEEPLDVLRASRGDRALLVGTEGEGLPDAVLARARRVRVAMGGAMDSLNVVVAASLALHEATR
jgi:tRNA G18 (ribose-2'-O)-methylase SpoU